MLVFGARRGHDGAPMELTPREREVMELVVVGRHNREIANALDEDRWPEPWGPRYRNIP